MRVKKGKNMLFEKFMNFIEFFKSVNFTELLVNVTEFFNLDHNNNNKNKT